ncbi:DMT family transporter [Nocardioides panaciterrulae]|uniref:Drug/metabolite transporter (DMT)-like permease n=1 Tax=Nocardioides panaciterrulae TaxID=661492 RepID=A0A7Y9JBT2_9ACTN|nr:DMT family transporter [Nocardioides panaciterrulae]NYD42516.1 drug/metabolite transporter (DMT)-like permease [Nocardioides panaciterrulae]
MSSSRPPALLAATVTTLSWGGMFVVAESAFAHVDAVWQTALRYGAASVVFLVLLAFREGRAAFTPSRQLLPVAALGTIGFAGFNLLAFVGLRWTTPQAASLIVSTMPLLTAFVLWARTGVRPRPLTWATGAVALVGVATVLGDGDPAAVLHGGLNRGDLLVLLGATSWVVYTTGAAGFPQWSPLRYTALSATAGSVVIVVLALALSAAGVLVVPTAGDVAAIGWQLAYVIVVAAVVAVLCWNHAMRVLGAQDGVLFINLVPVTTFTIQALRGDAPHAGELVGVALTLGALVANNLLGRRDGRRAQRAGAASTSATASSPRRTSANEVDSGDSPILSPSGSR